MTASFSAKRRYQVFRHPHQRSVLTCGGGPTHRPLPQCNSVDGLYPLTGPHLSTPPKRSSHSRSRPLPQGLVPALFAVETAPTKGWCLQVRPCARHRSCGSGLDREFFSETALSGNSAIHIRGPFRHAAILQPIGLCSMQQRRRTVSIDGPAPEYSPEAIEPFAVKTAPTGVSAGTLTVETAPTEGWCLRVRLCARHRFCGSGLDREFFSEAALLRNGPPVSSAHPKRRWFPQPSTLSLNATASTNYTHSARRALPRTPLRPVLAWHRCPAESRYDRCNPTRSPVGFRSPGPWHRKYPAR